MLYCLTPLTSISGRATAVKPYRGGLTNLLTGPTLQTRIVLAASVDTAVNSLVKTSTVLNTMKFISINFSDIDFTPAPHPLAGHRKHKPTNRLENKSFACTTFIWVFERDLVVFCHSLSLLSTPGYYRQALKLHTRFKRTPGCYERFLITCSRLIRARAQHGHRLLRTILWDKVSLNFTLGTM